MYMYTTAGNLSYGQRQVMASRQEKMPLSKRLQGMGVGHVVRMCAPYAVVVYCMSCCDVDYFTGPQSQASS